MDFTAEQQSDLERHREVLAKLLRIADDELTQHPAAVLCPRQAALLQQLESAFAGQSCPPGESLLRGGLAEDDYRHPAVIDYVNATDTTPRNNWQAISPQLLQACEDALFFMESPAFCYVLPAYLRQYLLRPGYMCVDSIFYLLDYNRCNDKLDCLTTDQRSVVQDILNEYRCRQQKINGDIDDTLLPWEHEQLLQQNKETTPWTFAGNIALEYAERHGISL